MTNVVTRNGTGHQTTQVPARVLGIRVRDRKTWSVSKPGGEDRIVEETPTGLFSIVDWHCLDLQGLRRVHAVLGYILQDEAAREDRLPEAEF